MSLQERHPNSPQPTHPFQSADRDYNRQFYEEYTKIFKTAWTLSGQLRSLLESKESMWGRLLDYEKRAQEEFKDKMRREKPERKKRHRRTAGEIEKKYPCNAPRCGRVYGSEGSLIQHFKLKHPELHANQQKEESRVEEQQEDSEQ